MYVIGLIFAITLAAVAVRLLYVGRRGTLVGNAWHCVGCDYRLTGLPDSTACPECGRDTTRPAGRRIGSQRRSNTAILTAIGLAIVAIVLATVTAPPVLRAVPWRKASPTFVQSWQLSGRFAEPAADELMRRVLNQSISASQARAIVRVCLDRQADPNRPWDWMLGNIVEGLRNQGLCSDADWAEYAKNAPAMWLDTRYTVRPGDTVRWTLALEEPRTAGWMPPNRWPDPAGENEVRPRPSADLILLYRFAGIDSGQGAVPAAEQAWRIQGATGLPSRNNRWLGEQGFASLPTTLPVGETIVTYYFDFAVADTKGDRNRRWETSDGSLVSWRQAFAVKVKVEPRGSDTVKVLPPTDPTLRQKVANSVKLLPSVAEPDRRLLNAVVMHGGGSYGGFVLGWDQPAVAMAFDVSVRREDGHEVWVGGTYADAGADRATSVDFHEAEFWGGTGKTVDILLRPSVRIAQLLGKSDAIWGGGYELKNVPVLWLKPPAFDPDAPPDRRTFVGDVIPTDPAAAPQAAATQFVPFDP